MTWRLRKPLRDFVLVCSHGDAQSAPKSITTVNLSATNIQLISNYRFWTLSSNKSTIPSRRFTGPTTTRATIVSAHFLPSPYLLCNQRLSICLHYLEILLTAIQVRCRVHRAQYRITRREHCRHGRPQDWCREWSSLGAATARFSRRQTLQKETKDGRECVAEDRGHGEGTRRFTAPTANTEHVRSLHG
jgi:hypothetical protein